ncbi:MAG: PDZ domain-containing protein [Desulfurellaceae bacterium]|nr:PDZ domain-containing protein [Desulfurellaceae bacterium]
MKYSACVIVTVVTVSFFFQPSPAAANPCQEAHEYLGLTLHPTRQEDASGLPIAEITQLTPGSRVGLRKGDVLEQVNSWPIQDCKSYRNAVRDAQKKQKAVLLLVARKGKRRPIFFEPEIWQRIEEKKEEKQAVASLQTMLTAPLPEGVQARTGAIGDQALATLRGLETLAVLSGSLPVYEKSVREARNRIRTLNRQSQGEAEKRVVAGARVLFGYYETAQAIRQYKHDYLSSERKDIRQGRAASFRSETVPYFYDSPVTAWVDRYPFLRSSIKDSPDKLGFDFIERPGSWDPDRAVQLLWRQARNETDKFAQWMNGQANARPTP